MTTTMTPERWAELRYPIDLRYINEGDMSYWHATIPALGRYRFVGDGDTPEEALAALEDCRLSMLDILLEQGKPIPLPEEEEDLPSGNFVVRMPRSLHATLKAKAEAEGVSLNSYVVHCINKGLDTDVFESAVNRGVSNILLHSAKASQAVGMATIKALFEAQINRVGAAATANSKTIAADDWLNEWHTTVGKLTSGETRATLRSGLLKKRTDDWYLPMERNR